jgi:hypothetical protein
MQRLQLPRHIADKQEYGGTRGWLLIRSLSHLHHAPEIENSAVILQAVCNSSAPGAFPAANREQPSKIVNTRSWVMILRERKLLPSDVGVSRVNGAIRERRREDYVKRDQLDKMQTGAWLMWISLDHLRRKLVDDAVGIFGSLLYIH